jgi:chromosome segregation ATPase
MLLPLVAVGVVDAARAQTARNSGEGNAQIQAQLQQLAAERTALQAENGKLKKDLEDAKRELEKIQAGQASATQRARSNEAALSRSAADRESLERQLAAEKTRLQELVAKFRETAGTLQTVETERTALTQRLEVRDRQYDQCVAANGQLIAMNGEILDRLEGKGTWSRLASAEPFTQLKRVQLENLSDEYRYLASEQRVPAEPVP